jgi:hypothetical protein
MVNDVESGDKKKGPAETGKFPPDEGDWVEVIAPPPHALNLHRLVFSPSPLQLLDRHQDPAPHCWDDALRQSRLAGKKAQLPCKPLSSAS